MKLFDQLAAAAGRVSSNRKKPTNKPYEARQHKADAAYRKLLTYAELTTGEIAAALRHTHCGTLSSLHKMEKRGLVVRVGVRERAEGQLKGRGSTIWTWNHASENTGNTGGAAEDRDAPEVRHDHDHV